MLWGGADTTRVNTYPPPPRKLPVLSVQVGVTSRKLKFNQLLGPNQPTLLGTSAKSKIKHPENQEFEGKYPVVLHSFCNSRWKKKCRKDREKERKSRWSTTLCWVEKGDNGVNGQHSIQLNSPETTVAQDQAPMVKFCPFYAISGHIRKILVTQSRI